MSVQSSLDADDGYMGMRAEYRRLEPDAHETALMMGRHDLAGAGSWLRQLPADVFSTIYDDYRYPPPVMPRNESQRVRDDQSLYAEEARPPDMQLHRNPAGELVYGRSEDGAWLRPTTVDGGHYTDVFGYQWYTSGRPVTPAYHPDGRAAFVDIAGVPREVGTGRVLHGAYPLEHAAASPASPSYYPPSPSYSPPSPSYSPQQPLYPL